MTLFKSKKGFTLVELVVAIAILVVLSTVLVPSFLNITSTSKESKDEVKFETLTTVFEKAVSEKEVLLSLENNDYYKDNGTDEDNTIYIGYNIGSKGEIIFANGVMFYKNGDTRELHFSESKIWLNSYQSVDKSYKCDNKNNYNKVLLYTIIPKTTQSVASCKYQVVEKSDLPANIKNYF